GGSRPTRWPSRSLPLRRVITASASLTIAIATSPNPPERRSLSSEAPWHSTIPTRNLGRRDVSRREHSNPIVEDDVLAHAHRLGPCEPQHRIVKVRCAHPAGQLDRRRRARPKRHMGRRCHRELAKGHFTKKRVRHLRLQPDSLGFSLALAVEHLRYDNDCQD